MKFTTSPISDEITLAEMLNDSSIDRVMAIDSGWNIIAWNRTSELVSGLLKADVTGKNLLELFPAIIEDDEIMGAIHDAFEGRKTFVPSAVGMFNRQYVENHFIPIRDNSGKVLGVMNIMHDVAHRIKVEKQLMKLNAALEKKYMQLEKANNDLATFTYIAGRDIKEPIKHVYTSLEMMARKEGPNLSNASRGNLRKMQASLNRMNLLLDDILAISRVSNYNLQFEPVDLNDVLSNLENVIHDKLIAKSVGVESDKLPVIKGSSEMLGYLFHHIIDNAIKFQEGNGLAQIRIKAALVGSDTSHKQMTPGQQYHEISFTDNGIGFDPADSERLFNMFEKVHNRDFRGSGVGLAVCKKIMDAHEGLITAEGRPGQGATFRCYFPVDSEE